VPLLAQGVGGAGDLRVEILDLSGGDISTAPVLGGINASESDLGPLNTTLDLNNITATFFDLSSLNLQIQGGDQLAFRLSTRRALPNLYALGIALQDLYSGGEYFVGTTLVPNADAAFKTFVVSTDCTLNVALSYENTGTLLMDFEIGSTVPAKWSLWIVTGGTAFPLVSAFELGVIDPPVAFPIPLQLPPLGTIGVLTILETDADGIICWDFIVDAGPGPQAAAPATKETKSASARTSRPRWGRLPPCTSLRTTSFAS